MCLGQTPLEQGVNVQRSGCLMPGIIFQASAPEEGQNQALETFHASVGFCLVDFLGRVGLVVFFFFPKQCSSSLTQLEEMKQRVQ